MATGGAVKLNPEHEATLEWQAILRKARSASLKRSHHCETRVKGVCDGLERRGCGLLRSPLDAF